MANEKKPEVPPPLDDGGGKKKEEKAEPLSLRTPDLTARERKLVAEALEEERIKNHSRQVEADKAVIEKNRQLVREYINALFADPREIRLREMAKLLPKEMMFVPLDAVITYDMLVRQLSSNYLYVRLYLQWLNDIVADDAIEVLDMRDELSARGQELYQKLDHLKQIFSNQETVSRMQRHEYFGGLANWVLVKINLLRELGIDEERLSQTAFEKWFQSKRREPQ